MIVLPEIIFQKFLRELIKFVLYVFVSDDALKALWEKMVTDEQ